MNQMQLSPVPSPTSAKMMAKEFLLKKEKSTNPQGEGEQKRIQELTEDFSTLLEGTEWR